MPTFSVHIRILVAYGCRDVPDVRFSPCVLAIINKDRSGGIGGLNLLIPHHLRAASIWSIRIHCHIVVYGFSEASGIISLSTVRDSKAVMRSVKGGSAGRLP